MTKLSSYEEEKQRNIAKNRELLESLGLAKPLFEPKQKKPAPKKGKQNKRTADDLYEEAEESDAKSDGSEPTPPKKSRKTEEDLDQTGLRRSTRSRKAATQGLPESAAVQSGLRKKAKNAGNMGSDDGVRRINFRQFGGIPGVEVGTWWPGRKGCHVDAVHSPLVAGISGSNKSGAYSVVISGGYEDDVDEGYAFTYTGSGGRDLKGTKNAPKNLRTAPQSSDQTFDNDYNKALLLSSETRKPVRVVRGFKCKSRYAPYEGYRYDGLYVVEKAWLEKGLNPKGYKVCRFAFKRLPDQPPIPVRETDEEQRTEDDAEATGEDEGEGEEGEDDIVKDDGDGDEAVEQDKN